MPRYFFDSANGEREPDNEGIELPDLQAAHGMAMQFAGEVLQSQPDEIWQEGQWRVEVTDEEGVLLFTVITLAIDAPTRARRKAGETPPEDQD